MPQCSICPFWDTRISPNVGFALIAPTISRLSALHLKQRANAPKAISGRGNWPLQTATQNEGGRSTCFCGASLEEPSFTEKSKPHTSSRTSSSFEFAANRSYADL